MIFYNDKACLVTVALIFSCIALDYFYYYHLLSEFFIIRFISAILVLFLGLVVTKFFSDEKSIYITYIWILIPQLMIGIMINMSGGEISMFFIGLCFAFFGISFLIPFSFPALLIFSFIPLLIYTLACLINSNQEFYTHSFLSNLTFLSLCSLTCIALSIFNEMWRIESFKLKSKLADTIEELYGINHKLTEVKGHMIQQEKMSALGTLSAGLLHELNNPVSYSLLAISMLENEAEIKSNPHIQEGVTDAKEGLQRVANIVRDLKTFAYQKSGEAAERPFSFETTLNSAFRLCSFELKGVDMRYDLPLDTYVKGDEPGIIGVLINLLTNSAYALRKSGENAPFIHIVARQGNEPQTHLRRLFVTVKDNGTGIQKDDLNKIFEPFFTTRDVGQGLGLGLAVSYSIIQRHGSELTVTSAAGAWTQFAFSLPIADVTNE
jgi:two-component system, sensor histidine kinase PhcS